MEPIDDLFGRLDNWRHLPKYQLERRADIFFAVYLHDFLESKLETKLHPQLVPEFPLLKQLVGDTSRGDECCNVDYLAVAQDRSAAYLIELKTDPLSLRDVQNKYLRKASGLSMRDLTEGVRQVALASRHKRKYVHLLVLLEQVGLIPASQSLKPWLTETHLHGVRKAIDKIKVEDIKCNPSVVYLLPPGRRCELMKERFYTFDDFRRWIEGRFHDPLSVRFAKSLERWSTAEAGACDADD